MERREVAETALKQMCDRIGVRYTTESQPEEGAWFLSTVTP
jgi:ATP-dependent DNA ligase